MDLPVTRFVNQINFFTFSCQASNILLTQNRLRQSVTHLQQPKPSIAREAEPWGRRKCVKQSCCSTVVLALRDRQTFSDFHLLHMRPPGSSHSGVTAGTQPSHMGDSVLKGFSNTDIFTFSSLIRLDMMNEYHSHLCHFHGQTQILKTSPLSLVVE